MVWNKSRFSPVRLKTVFLAVIVLAVLSVPLSADDFGADLPTVKKIVILGNRSFEDKVLKKRMRTREAGFFSFFRKPSFRRDFLRRDIEAVRTFYNINGFFDASVSLESLDRDESDNSVSIRIMINEGVQTTVRTLSLGRSSLIDDSELRKGLKLTEDKPYNPNLLDVDKYTIFSKFFERGYLGAMVSCETVVDSARVDISWEMAPGNPIKIKDIFISGNGSVVERLIRRELRVRSGEYFNLAKIVESKQNLYSTGCFTSVEVEPRALDIEKGSVDLHLQVRERKMGYVETGFGVGNVHANRVFAEWGQRNVLGRGYALNTRSEFAFSLFREGDYSIDRMDLENKFERHEMELAFPHILSTWNTFIIGAFYERDATVEPIVVEAVSFNGTVSRRFSRHTSFLLGYFYEKVRREAVVDEKEKSRRRSIDATFRRDTRDFYFNPRRGHYITFESRIAGGILGGEDNYYSIIPSYQEYRTMGESTTIAYRIRVGYARAFGDSREAGLPVESRFFLGGGNSVRGYEENSLGPVGSTGESKGGNVMVLTNLELRFPIPYISKYNFGGAAFIDAGNSWNGFDDISMHDFNLFREEAEVMPDDLRVSIGFGIRYYTPVGPIRIDLGFPVVRSVDMDFDYRLHISLGQIF
ncbi:MAG: outer membrane protein assembly factor BamA [Candidatus Krumholzibacteria bacterium]|nr:outer membrane protein assembly factor BamA [Candidatus Krumholzibacteria bacterium]